MSAPVWSLRWRYAGRTVVYSDLDIRWMESQDLYQTRPTMMTVEATISPRPEQDPNTYANEGWHPIGSDVALLRGSVVMLSGSVQGCTYDGDGGSVTLTISSQSASDSGSIPPQGESFIKVITQRFVGDGVEYTRDDEGQLPKQYEGATSKRVFTNVANKGEGVNYPLVYGAPGSEDHPGSPAIIIDAQTGLATDLMIAGHAVEATSVTVWGPDGDNNLVSKSGVAVLHGRDSQGRVYAYVKMLTSWTSTEPDGQNYDGQFYVSWTGGRALPGGAGDLLTMLYQMSTLDVDVSAFQAAAPRLNAYILAGYVNEIVTPSEYAERVVLPILPVSIVRGRGGLAPQVWPSLDVDDGPALRLRHGLNAHRSGPVRYLTDTPYPSFTVEYGFRPDTAVFTRRAKADASSTVHGLVAQQQSPATGGSDRTQTRIVWDEQTAEAIAFDRVRALGVPPRTASYTVSAADFGIESPRALRVGMPVAITDAGRGWSERAAVVGEIARGGDDLSVVLYLRDSPLFG